LIAEARTRDNVVVFIPRGVAQQAALEASVRDAVNALGDDVIRVRYTLGQDWSGEHAIFFRILLSDRASKRGQLLHVTRRVTNQIVQRLEPVEQWGLVPYFDFRSQSEQAALKEEAWA
jgi:hypothetical protein